MGKYFYKLTEKDMEGTRLFMSDNSTSIIENEFTRKIGKAEADVRKQIDNWQKDWDERNKKWTIEHLKDNRRFYPILGVWSFIVSIFSFNMSNDAFQSANNSYPEEVNGYIAVSGVFFAIAAGVSAFCAGKLLADAVSAHRELKKLK